jgi:F-type H+-transporting ATPase subunit d
LVELKEAEEKSLKESERLEKEIADVQELKVIEITTSIFQFYEIEKSLIHCLF